MKAALSRMHLTDDDVHVLFALGRPVPVRVRIWRERGTRPVVLVEPAGGEPIRGDACRVATYLVNCLLKGQDFVYVEHELDDQWWAVTFVWMRHSATDPYRKTLARRDVEAVLGDAIPA